MGDFMNFEEFKKKADVFFKEVKPKDIVKEFEELGLYLEDEIVYDIVNKKENNFREENF